MRESLVAKNVKRIIKEKKLLQYAVAEEAGYQTNKFNAMLNGRKVIYDVDIMNIAKALNVTPNDLFKEQQPQQPA